MKDHSANVIDPRDLTSRLIHIEKSPSTPNDGDSISRLPRMSRAGTASFDGSSAVYASLPTFGTSTTSSTVASDPVSRLEVMRTVPLSSTYSEPVEVGQGDFSKPRIRRRRASNESAKSARTVPEFQYYGRHANSWLFNDFSITDSVKKGWGKIFHGKTGEEE